MAIYQVNQNWLQTKKSIHMYVRMCSQYLTSSSLIHAIAFEGRTYSRRQWTLFLLYSRSLRCSLTSANLEHTICNLFFPVTCVP